MNSASPTPHWIGSRFGVFFASISALSIGVLLGCMELILHKVVISDGARTLIPATEVFFTQGDYMGGENWQRKFARIADPQARVVSLTEGDLNLFIQNSFSSDQTSNTRLTGNVRISKNRIHLGIFISSKYLKNPLCLQFSGEIEKGKTGFYFDPKRAYFGGLPIPEGVAKPFINNVFRKIFENPQFAGLLRAWERLHTVSLSNSTLRLAW